MKQSYLIITLFYLSIFFNLGNAQTLSSIAYGGESEYVNISNQCLSNKQRLEIMKENSFQINELNMLLRKERSFNLNSMGWPLKSSSLLNSFSYYGIAFFVDHDPDFPNHLLDYFGGERSYDLENGYNHQGTDFFPWPFAWYVMDYDLVEIVSMASGIIIGKDDGNYDRNCERNNENWNAVYILHDNGIIAWYGHLKNGSVTSKSAGESVEKGEYLGIIGSSGSSTAPHLHLELYDTDYNLIDPWEGPYNPTINSSLWEMQPPYYDSKVNKIASHSKWPEFPECPQQEILNLKDEFQPGDTVFLVVYYQDQLKDQVSEHTITSPDNNVWTWSHSITDEHYIASYWGWWIILPSNASIGEWEFSVFFNNRLYTHDFTVKDVTDVAEKINLPEKFSLSQNYPNPFNPSTTIKLAIPSSESTHEFSLQTSLIVYDILGREVAILINQKLQPGNHIIKFDAGSLSSGMYFYRVNVGNKFNSVMKMLLAK